ncbi:hypothetical protein FJY90_04800 [Candidatus Gottesmanbacteria bacterium]|nr:hypothetical protein [Candidatus Gottesmanbacteria bacterium]
MIKKLQFVLLFSRSFIIKHKKFIIIGGISGFLSVLFFISSYSFFSGFPIKSYKKIGIVGKFTEESLPLFILNKISFGLTSLTPEGDAIPSLAESWKTDDNGTNYTFSLRSDLYWHDGTNFTATDVNYLLKGMTITAVDKTTVSIKLQDLYAPLPVIVSRPIVKENFTGLGLYKVTKVKYTGDTLTGLSLSPQKENLPYIIYKFYSNLDDALLAYKLGEIDILEGVSSTGNLDNWKNSKVSKITLYDRYVGIFFNLKDPLFKEKETRQALAYATPSIDDYEKAYSPISPLSWAYSEKIRLYRFDPETARKILTKSPIASSTTQITLSTYTSFLHTAQTIIDAWRKIGINAKIKVETSIPSDFQILLISQIIPPDPDQYQYWQSTQESTNLTHYSNLRIDKLLEDGRRTLDKETRKGIYADFQRYLVDDAPVIFLYYPKVYRVERK